MKISLVMITLNEEDRIQDALKSAQGVADEIVIVDSGSNDRTTEIARTFGARVVTRPFSDYADQKNFARTQASHDWVLNLDADERLSPELREQILAWKELKNSRASGYRIRRKTWYLGRWITHSGWYPDCKLRLFQRDRSEWRGRVHERLELEGDVESMQGEILHYTYRDTADHVARINRYTSMQAADIAERKTLLLARALVLPPVTFLRHYIWRLGFLDGFPGLVIALVASWGTAMKYLKARSIQKKVN